MLCTVYAYSYTGTVLYLEILPLFPDFLEPLLDDGEGRRVGHAKHQQESVGRGDRQPGGMGTCQMSSRAELSRSTHARTPGVPSV